MDRRHIFVIAALATLLAGLAVGSAVLAQTSASYNLEWHVIGGGGEPVTSAHYAVNSTAGQGAASPPYSISSSYALSGGYWFGGAPFAIYLPLVMR
jgi:hypothetical protein